MSKGSYVHHVCLRLSKDLWQPQQVRDLQSEVQTRLPVREGNCPPQQQMHQAKEMSQVNLHLNAIMVVDKIVLRWPMISRCYQRSWPQWRHRDVSSATGNRQCYRIEEGASRNGAELLRSRWKTDIFVLLKVQQETKNCWLYMGLLVLKLSPECARTDIQTGQLKMALGCWGDCIMW